MTSILVVGYGNLSRRDDGVAFHVIHRLRQRLGFAEEHIDELGENLDDNPATMIVHQLAPELAETLADYDIVVFVDAHVDAPEWPPVHWEEIAPTYRAGIVAHHLVPSTVLALCKSLFGRHPKGFVLSILGVDFDFGEELSTTTAPLVDEAVERLVVLLRSENLA